MASINVKTNIKQVTDAISAKLRAASDKEYLLRPLAFGVIDRMTKRIHMEGKAADGGQIGTYSTGYLALRKKKYNRKADNKVIVSLTRQLEADWSVIATPKGYGVGFQNAFNLKKARWVEETKKKEIFSLTDDELKYVSEEANNLVNEALK